MTEVSRPAWASSHPLLAHYYDTEWGFPVKDERGVFERICLEAFQSGLSWLTILKRREGFRNAFAHFDPEIVATFAETDVARLMADEAIIRNKLKIDATINNASATVAMRALGGLENLVWSFKPPKEAFDPRATFSPESIALSKALKQSGFKFVGPTTVYALMEAIGMVNPRVKQ